MSQLKVSPTDDVEFAANSSVEGSRLNLYVRGNADLRAKSRLDTFLQAADDQAQSMNAEEVVVDFRELVFMNSSCIKGFVHWLGTVQEREEAKQYRIRFLSDPAAHWQSRSLQALSAFAPKIVTVT